MQEKGYFSSKGWPYLFLAPQLLIVIIFFIWPAVQSCFHSFIIEDMTSLHSHLTGLENYLTLFKSAAYWRAIGITLIFSFAVTFISLVSGLFFAQLVSRVTRGKIFYQFLFCLPYAIAPAVAGMIMRFLFDPTVGILTHWLSLAGIHANYLTSPTAALLLLILTACWQQMSYNFIFYLIGLQTMPSSVIDAAKLDGANMLQRFWHITLPLLAPITFFLLITNLMYAFFSTFGMLQVLTQGGPGDSAQMLVLKVYQAGVVNLNLSSAGAQSMILIAIAGVLVACLFRYVKKESA